MMVSTLARLRVLSGIVEANRERIERAWNEFFG
jgi:hypothetical protein